MRYCGSFHACVHVLPRDVFVAVFIEYSIFGSHQAWMVQFSLAVVTTFLLFDTHATYHKRACNFHGCLSTKIKTHEIAFKPKHKNLSQEI